MKKFLSLSLVLMLVLALFAGCASKPAATEEPAKEPAKEEPADAVTTASIVDNADALANAMSKDGNWIFAILNDVSTDKELVVEGEFHNKGDSAKEVYRKFAPYTQDADHKVTGEFTLTAPKLTVKSPNFKIQNGTFVGDIYVEANGFNLKGAKVQGNVYFANEEYKNSFVNDGATISGATEVKASADVVTTASIVDNADALANAMSKDGNWIFAILNDVSTDKELVVEGEFHNKGDSAKEVYRKFAPYTQDENHKVTGEFTLTAPKLTVKSPNFKFQNGTFVGDIYVEANGFTLAGTKVQGNVYFANEEYKNSFVNDGATISGATEVK